MPQSVKTKWASEGLVFGPFTPKEMMKNWSADMAGWWEVYQEIPVTLPNAGNFSGAEAMIMFGMISMIVAGTTIILKSKKSSEKPE